MVSRDRLTKFAVRFVRAAKAWAIGMCMFAVFLATGAAFIFALDYIKILLGPQTIFLAIAAFFVSMFAWLVGEIFLQRNDPIDLGVDYDKDA